MVQSTAIKNWNIFRKFQYCVYMQFSNTYLISFSHITRNTLQVFDLSLKTSKFLIHAYINKKCANYFIKQIYHIRGNTLVSRNVSLLNKDKKVYSENLYPDTEI